MESGLKVEAWSVTFDTQAERQPWLFFGFRGTANLPNMLQDMLAWPVKMPDYISQEGMPEAWVHCGFEYVCVP